jgi:polyhydroxyalkanoate synthesis regulator phasin
MVAAELSKSSGESPSDTVSDNAEVDALRARVSELEAELSSLSSVSDHPRADSADSDALRSEVESLRLRVSELEAEAAAASAAAHETGERLACL